MLREIKNIVEDEKCFTLVSLANNVVKIVIDTPDNFRKMVKGLKAKKIAFYTYQLKTERAFKVVICNLHHTIDPEDIKKALEEEGHVARNVVNIRHPATKVPLPLWFVDLEPKDNNKAIYDLRYLQQTKVLVEAPKPRRELIQCKRCQRFGHT